MIMKRTLVLTLAVLEYLARVMVAVELIGYQAVVVAVKEQQVKYLIPMGETTAVMGVMAEQVVSVVVA